MGLPAHVEVLFGAATLEDRQPGTPIMYIIPVDAYLRMWDAAGDPTVSSQVDKIFQYTVALPSPAPASMPALPVEEVVGHNDVAVQAGRAVTDTAGTSPSASKSGFRFVGRWAQDANPVINQNLKYVYQGFTNDGKYLVSFFYPVTTPKLPRSQEEVTAGQMERFNTNPTAAIQMQAQMLDALAPSDWDPNLNTLDALVASLEIARMKSAGLLEQPWVLAGVEPGGGVKPLTDTTRHYEVLFMADGNLAYQADCNRGSGTFTYHGGMTGGLRSTLGLATMAECNDNGQGQMFVNGLMSSQDFRVLPGGSPFKLILPAGGGSLVFGPK